MGNFSALVSFLHQTGLDQVFSVLGNGFEIRSQNLGDLENGDACSPIDQEQYLNAMVVGHPLEMALHLLRRLGCFSHTGIIQHSYILQNVGMLPDSSVEMVRRGKPRACRPVVPLPSRRRVSAAAPVSLSRGRRPAPGGSP